nr:helveticin J family class III bacteriocin [Lactobacillus sp.]
MPWKSTDPSDWEEVNLKYNSELDAVNEYGNKYLTEFEGIQLINDNDLYLTVAYHNPNADPVNQTTMNRIYRVSWTSSLS